MKFKEYLAQLNEANKYAFGAWKRVIQLIIDDFMEAPDDKLKKMLEKMKLHELRNTIHNAIAFSELQDVKSDKQKSKFLMKLIDFAKKEFDNKHIQDSSNTIDNVTEDDWKNFENLLKDYDPHYNKSEDPKVYQKGAKIADAVKHQYKILSKVDQKRAEKLMKNSRQK